MRVKIHLSLELEESSIGALGTPYKCKIIAIVNGVEEKFIFDDPIAALDQGRKLAFSWVQTFIKLKRDTRNKLRKMPKPLQKSKPKLIIP